MELFTEVLKRLPVKAIARFGRVCKAWRSLISSNHFVSLHRSHVRKQDSDHSHLLTSYICDKNDQLVLRSVDTYMEVLDCNYRIRIPQHLDGLRNFRIIRSCDSGLLLLVKEFRRPWELILWNPLLGKTHTLPLPPYKPIRQYSFGHGFNSLNNDYKVLMISLHPHTLVHIYDLSVRTWRSITDYDANIIGNVQSLSGVLMEGNIHWISYAEFNYYMLSFDVNDEVFNYVMLPRELYLFNQAQYPVIYREKVGLLNVTTTNICSLWVMKKDKSPVRWIKLYQVDLSMKLYYSFSCTTIRLLNFNKDGQLMFATRNGDVKLYDFESQKLKSVMETFPHDIQDSYYTLYRESLLLL